MVLLVRHERYLNYNFNWFAGIGGERLPGKIEKRYLLEKQITWKECGFGKRVEFGWCETSWQPVNSDRSFNETIYK